jgi:hypothetical protein
MVWATFAFLDSFRAQNRNPVWRPAFRRKYLLLIARTKFVRNAKWDENTLIRSKIGRQSPSGVFSQNVSPGYPDCIFSGHCEKQIGQNALFRQDLNSSVPAELLILRLIHQPHAAFAELTGGFVMAQLLANHKEASSRQPVRCNEIQFKKLGLFCRSWITQFNGDRANETAASCGTLSPSAQWFKDLD